MMWLLVGYDIPLLFNLTGSKRMKNLVSSLVVLVVALSVTWPAQARDTKLLLPIAAAMAMPETKEKLGDSVKFYFGSQTSPKILKNFGNGVSNRKTNSATKSDVKACNWAFLSALIDLQAGAKEEGANAVTHVVSYYKKQEMSSPTLFECHAGAVVAGVALKGDYAKIAR